MSESDAEREAMCAAARLLDLDLDPAGARLISASSRLIWHLSLPAVALTISRPATKSCEDVTAETDVMHAATIAGVRPPALRGGSVAVPGDC